MDACAYLEEPIIMTFGEFRFGVNKEGSYRLEVPISSEFSAVDSNFSSSDEEFSSTRFIDSKASGKLAKIFSNTSFESSADSFISSDSESVDSFNFIDKSVAIGRSNVDPNNVPLASLVAQEENVDVNFIKNNNFNNNAYRNNSGNNYRPYPSANGNGYGNSYGNSYNNNRSVPSGLEAMLKEFISTQTAFNKSVEEKLDKIDIIASRVDRLASDVNLLKLKVMPNNDIDNKITTTANAIQVRINKNIRLMAELRARWDREENEKLAKENNVAKVWTITTTSNANSSHVAAPPTINGKIIGVGNVSTPSAKRTKLPEIAKAETACDKTAEIFSNLGNNDPIAVAHNDLDFDDCHISEVIKFLQKLAKSPNASAINLAFTKHITNALIKAREEKLKLETSIPRKLEDGWEPIIKMKFNDFECNALCDLGASISVMPKKIYDMLDLPPLKNCYLDVNLADNVKNKPLGRIDNVHITVNNNLVPVDFVVLDIECNASCPIVLGRPFLRTVGAVIDMRKIRLKEEDEAKTAFITPYGVFCYKTMPFGLKNAGATYQRMMQKCLATQIGKNVQVYIDDVVITSKKGSTLIEDLKETFDNLDKFCLKLNPTKCSFGVPAGELLGFLVSARGIEANPEKIQAIVTMRKPTKLKEIQQLTGRVAALSRFVARLGEKALPFYALIKQGGKFQWNEEADRAFENLKRAISTPPILVAPKEKEPLLLYIAATPQVVSTALVVEREEEGKLHGVQRPVYFISEVLSPSKQRYPQYQKLAYGVFTTARKLRHYFSAHPIIVVNEAPLSNILNNPEATGRVSLWGIELSPRDITYEKRKAIKSQVLPDFIAEWMELQNTGPPDLSRTWTMNFDGSKRLEGAGAGVILVSPEGDKLKYVLRMTFPNASNNEAEYEALIHGMKMAKACGATRLKIFGDSQLVAQQVMNQCDAVNESMIAYKEVYNELEKLFDGCEVNHISRMSNDEADVLANIGSQCLAIPPGVFWEEISERSTKPAKTKKEKKEKTSSITKDTAEEEEEQELVMMVQIPWMQAYISYILRKTIPDDPVEARRIIRRSKAFTVVKGELYKRSISGVLQRCVTPEEGRIILKDVHEGICGHHASSRAIAAKVFRAGFYWLTAIEDAKEIVRTCDACQRFAARPHSPAAELMPIPLSWPFAQWGLDMVGKLHKASPGGYEYMLVAVDKFTKWIEAKPINSPDGASAIKFVKSIVFRFGVPHSIVTDNGSNFTSKEFKAYCAEVGIKLSFASVAHPQTNGQVEKANGIICNGIKKRLLGPLEKARHTWPEE
ncbi:hypothetical protein QYE76_047005 [Lolium multiflorum]|uniref:Uncharacterized protein n=1 Tax=Lolium multiflorum TaxID=4521 RepID=A0AAD8TQW7_LOLMU|nr:hypothetical protein QYE76_047005 [Lolium multiflorum]